MRKICTLSLVLLFFAMNSIAQQRTITGVVKDSKGIPVPFATVIETGTKNAVTADGNGVFTIKTIGAGTISFSAAGYTSKEITPGSGPQTVILDIKNSSLREVVVTTAFGIKKSSRVTPYSAQVIGNEQLKLIPQTNVNNALAGKVAGTQFRGQSPIKLNSQGSFRIRGGQGLGDVEPIYVVDGTIVNSLDINPDDIQDVSVLKGANATALFGGRAVNGAVVINTKKQGQSGTAGIELNQGYTFDKVYILPKYQNLYAGGSSADLIKFVYDPATMPAEQAALDGKYFPDYTDDASWGPKMVGQEYIPWYAWTPGHSRSFKTALLTPQKDNARDFWGTGKTSTTSLSLAKSGQGYNARVSFTNNNIIGLLPNSGAKRNTLSGSFSTDLSTHITAGTNFTFTSQVVNGVFDDGYANQSSGGMTQWFHRDLDMGIMKELRGLTTPIGTYASWNLRSNPDAGNTNIWKGNYWYNYYTWFDKINNINKRDRLFGDVFLTYKLNNNFRIKATVRKNQLTTGYENITPSVLETSGGQTGVLASYATGSTRYNEMNYELLASFNKTVLGKLAISVNAGSNWFQSEYKEYLLSTVNGLNVPDLYAISNSKANPSIGNRREREEQRALFANGDFEWNRWASISWAIRTDYYSTGFKGDNKLVSPALGGSLVFSEFTKNSIPWLSFGKLFGSWGKKPVPLTIYQNNFLYSVNQNQWNGNFLMTTPDALVDPAVTGALITTYEGGVDLKFINNKLGLNVTYYDETTDKAPVSILTDPVAGFTTKVVNAAKIKRQGIEVLLSATPIQTKDFSWEVNATYSRLIKNPVLNLAGQQRILLAGGAFGSNYARAFQELNQDWGQLIGGGIARTADGRPILDANGLFTADLDKHWGSVVPKTNGGLTNTLTYKGLVFNFSLDYQVGGKFFSLSESWGVYSGILEQTAAVNDKGMNIRDAVADGGGVHVTGVSADDNTKTVDTYIDAQTYYHQFYNNKIAEPFVHDLSYVKLRELSLGYQIPVKRLNVDGIVKGAVISFVARNPWLIYRQTKNFDPSEISAQQGEDGQLPGTRSIGFNLKLNF